MLDCGGYFCVLESCFPRAIRCKHTFLYYTDCCARSALAILQHSYFALYVFVLYGLLRAKRSRNPTNIRIPAMVNHRYMLMFVRVKNKTSLQHARMLERGFAFNTIIQKRPTTSLLCHRPPLYLTRKN